MITALAAKTELLSSPAVGTKVRMLFANHRTEIPELHHVSSSVGSGLAEPVRGDVVVSMAPVSLLSGARSREDSEALHATLVDSQSGTAVGN